MVSSSDEGRPDAHQRVIDEDQCILRVIQHSFDLRSGSVMRDIRLHETILIVGF
jgi:hypothetical protein